MMERKIKPLIYVFWEGESEQAYSRYLNSSRLWRNRFE